MIYFLHPSIITESDTKGRRLSESFTFPNLVSIVQTISALNMVQSGCLGLTKSLKSDLDWIKLTRGDGVM